MQVCQCLCADKALLLMHGMHALNSDVFVWQTAAAQDAAQFRCIDSVAQKVLIWHL